MDICNHLINRFRFKNEVAVSDGDRCWSLANCRSSIKTMKSKFKKYFSAFQSMYLLLYVTYHIEITQTNKKPGNDNQIEIDIEYRIELRPISEN